MSTPATTKPLRHFSCNILRQHSGPPARCHRPLLCCNGFTLALAPPPTHHWINTRSSWNLLSPGGKTTSSPLHATASLSPTGSDYEANVAASTLGIPAFGLVLHKKRLRGPTSIFAGGSGAYRFQSSVSKRSTLPNVDISKVGSCHTQCKTGGGERGSAFLFAANQRSKYARARCICHGAAATFSAVFRYSVSALGFMELLGTMSRGQ